MKKSCKYGVLVLAALLACLLAGCGREEKQRMGVDGYVYVAETIEQFSETTSGKFTVEGDYLYYLSGFGLNGASVVKRIPVEEIISSGNLSGGETVFTVSSVLASGGELENADNLRMAGIYDYAVDEEGNVYAILAAEKGILLGFAGGAVRDTEEETRSAQGVLCKQSPEGEIVFCTGMPDFRILWNNPDWLALDSRGRVYVLTAEAILAVGEDGKVEGSLPVELAANIDDMRGASGRLLEGEDGAAYYVEKKRGTSETTTYLLNEGEPLRMTVVPLLSSSSDLELFEGMDGVLLATSEGLYRCEVAENSMDEILKWEDSNLVANDVRDIAQIAGDRYLVTISPWAEIESRRMLLSRTPVEELPERESIVIASLRPSDDLRRCVVEFNLASEKYHVSIETYSGDIEGAYARLDASLVSRDAPDILDLSGLDVSKYAEREMLEDLNPYLERDGGIDREDYLGNLLEGFTIKNRLVSIPKKFNTWTAYRIPQDAGDAGSWTLGDLIALTEKYPERKIFTGGASVVGTRYLLQEFCAPYYLERFVDWKAGTCSFDCEEFCSLLEWVGVQDRKTGQAQEALLERSQLHFTEYEIILYGEATVMYGYPSVDGAGTYVPHVKDALGILAGSGNKDGAWEFLKYFLLDPGDGNDLPTRKEQLKARMEKDISTEWIYFIDGFPVERSGTGKEHADDVMRAIASIDFTPMSSLENSIADIVWEEAQYFLDGSKTAQEVAATVQNRAALALQEAKDS